MGDLLTIVPSRGRPDNIAALLRAWQETVTGDTGLLVAVDDDDPRLDAYRTVCRSVPLGFRPVVGPRERMGPTLNRRALERVDEFYAIGFMGDDHRPRTPSWDEKILAALREMGSGLAYGNDLVQGANLATAVFITSDIVKALGYFCPPKQIHLYLDNFWMVLGSALGRLAYLPDVVIEHDHPIAKRLPFEQWDDRYREVNAPEVYDHDRAAFEEWLRDDFEAAVERVEEAIGACV